MPDDKFDRQDVSGPPPIGACKGSLPARDPIGRLVHDRIDWSCSGEQRTVNKQTNSERRFTVIELPVFPIVAQSLVLPFNYLPELVKYGGIPYLLMLVARAISFLLAREDASSSATGGLRRLRILFCSRRFP